MESDHLRQRIEELLSDSPTDFQGGTVSSRTLAHDHITQISLLDEQVAWLRVVHKAITAEITARIVRASTYRNSLLPISRLPSETLSCILEASLGQFDATPQCTTTRRLLELATVCRRWKAILDENPSVWGWVDILHDAPFAVHKSRQAPLSINLVNEGYFDEPQLEQGLAVLSPHSERWQSLQLSLTVVATRDLAPVFASLSAPRLRDLGLFVNPRGCDDPPRLDNLDRYPLRRLVLSGVSTSWGVVAGFTELRSLKIADLSYGNAWPSREQITEILLGCRHLEELALSNLENYPQDVSVPPLPLSTLYLPALRSLELSDIINSREAALWLLECISAPRLKGLSVMASRRGRLIGRPMASVLKRQRPESPLPVVMESLRLRPVHVLMTQRGCRFECEHVLKRVAHHGVEIYFPGEWHADTYQEVVDIVSGVLENPPLQLHLEKLPQTYEPNPDPDPAFLGSLPTLSALHIKGVPNVEAFLQYLSSRGPGDSPNYYCPNLTEVHLDGWITLTGTQRDAATQLMDKRPHIALYDREGRTLGLRIREFTWQSCEAFSVMDMSIDFAKDSVPERLGGRRLGSPSKGDC